MVKLSNKKFHANGIYSNKKTHAMLFWATSKLMLSYLGHKETHAKGNLSNTDIHAPVSGTNILETKRLP